jgi:hypothetical protein
MGPTAAADGFEAEVTRLRGENARLEGEKGRLIPEAGRLNVAAVPAPVPPVVRAVLTPVGQVTMAPGALFAWNHGSWLPSAYRGDELSCSLSRLAELSIGKR